jgi:hypothetical protein
MTQAPDALLVAAVHLARTAAIAEAGDGELVGAPVGVEADDERLVTHLFEGYLPGYTAWRWAVTISRTEDVTNLDGVTVCDVVLLPGPDALLAPDWIPYEQRVQPGDLGVGDLLPTHADDPRLVPGYAALPADEELDPAQLWELGLGRARVLSSARGPRCRLKAVVLIRSRPTGRDCDQRPVALRLLRFLLADRRVAPLRIRCLQQ